MKAEVTDKLFGKFEVIEQDTGHVVLTTEQYKTVTLSYVG